MTYTMKSILCKLGWHDWLTWKDTNYDHQHRHCANCGVKQIRYVPQD